MGKADQVPGKAIAADVRALPHGPAQGPRERGSERPASLGAARIAPTVRADEEQGTIVDPADARRVPVRHGFEAQIQQVSRAGQREALYPWTVRSRVSQVAVVLSRLPRPAWPAHEYD